MLSTIDNEKCLDSIYKVVDIATSTLNQVSEDIRYARIQIEEILEGKKIKEQEPDIEIQSPEYQTEGYDPEEARRYNESIC